MGMRGAKAKVGVAIAAACAMLLAACSGGLHTLGDPQELQLVASQEAKSDELREGGTVKLPIAELPTQYNPMQVDARADADLAVTLAQFVTVRNWNMASDGSVKPNPDFVQKIEVKENPAEGVAMQLVFSLNPKAKWNSGEPITWADYEATWKACKENPANMGTADPDEHWLCASTEGYAQVAKVAEGSNEYEVLIDYAEAQPDWQATWATVNPADGTVDPSVFNTGWRDYRGAAKFQTGPFKILNADKKKRVITLAPNAAWWGEKPKLEAIQLVAINPGTQAQAFANGEIDVITGIRDVEDLEKVSQRQDAVIQVARGAQWRHLTLNARAGIFQDQKLRQAIAMGIDRSEIAKSDLEGLPIDPESALIGHHFLIPGQAGYADHALKYDPEAAAKLIEAAGYKMNEKSGFYEKEGEPLSFTFQRLPGTFPSDNEAKLIKEQLECIGVQVHYQDASSSDFFNNIFSGDYQATTFTWEGTEYPAQLAALTYGEKGANNFTGYSDPRIEEAIAKLSGTLDAKERVAVLNELDEYVWEGATVIPLYHRAQIDAVAGGLVNWRTGAFGSGAGALLGWVK